MDLRMTCLDNRLEELGALAKLFANADSALVDRAVQAAFELSSVASCGDVEALTSRVPPPADPRDRARAVAARTRLDQARARRHAGQYHDAMAIAAEVADEARELGYDPLRAEALVEVSGLGLATGDAKASEAAARQAIEAAATGKADAIAGRAWVALLASRLPQAGYQDMVTWEPFARAAAARGGTTTVEIDAVIGRALNAQGEFDSALARHTSALETRIAAAGPEHYQVAAHLNDVGDVLFRLGRYDEAISYQERAVAVAEKALGARHPQVAKYLISLCAVLHQTDRNREAMGLLERALVVFEQSVGPEHPFVAFTCTTLGNIAFAEGSYDRAHAYYQRALAIEEKVRGPKSGAVIPQLLGLGNVAAEQGDYARAEELYRRAVEVAEVTLGPTSHHLADPLGNLAYAAHLQGRWDEALALFDRELAIREQALGADHPTVVGTLNNIGDVLLELGRYRGAKQRLERALALAEKTLGKNHRRVGDALSGLAAAELGLRRPREAAELAERAVGIRAHVEDHPRYLAQSHYLLGRALWAAGGDRATRARARALVEQAIAVFEADGRRSARDLARARVWLRKRS